MRDLAVIRDRYLRDDISIRLGGLAANLARIQSFSDHPDHRDAVEHLIEESKYFIEWTAMDAAEEIREELVLLQIKLSVWQLNWKKIWENSENRASVGEQAGSLSRSILKRSGLII
jgi:hypothetical protein